MYVMKVYHNMKLRKYVNFVKLFKTLAKWHTQPPVLPFTMSDSGGAAVDVVGYLRTSGVVYELEEQETTIGRSAEADIVGCHNTSAVASCLSPR